MTESPITYDLTPFMAPFLDIHMFPPLLDFLCNDVCLMYLHYIDLFIVNNAQVKLYDEKVITKQKIKVIKKTNMLELLEDEYLKFPDDEELKSEYETLQLTVEDKKNEIFDLLDNPSDQVITIG